MTSPVGLPLLDRYGRGEDEFDNPNPALGHLAQRNAAVGRALKSIGAAPAEKPQPGKPARTFWGNVKEGFSNQWAETSRAWRGVQNLSTAFVAHHPDRRAVHFGLNTAPVDSGRSATYPYVLWTWDLERDTWGPDHKFSADLSFVAPIRTTTITAPSAPPVAGTPTHASATTTSVVPTWTNGDATANTEVWYKDETGGGSYILFSVEAPGATSTTITGLLQRRNYKVKFRHLKGGVYSVYSAEADAYTKLTAPTNIVFDIVTKTRVFLEVTQNAGVSDLIIEKNGVPQQTHSNAANGLYNHDALGLTCNTFYTFRARSFLAAWPAAIQYSDYVTDSVTTDAC